MASRKHKRLKAKEARQDMAVAATFTAEGPPGLRDCVDCGTVFELTDGERAWFVSKGMSVPRRCRACREIRRAEKAAAA